jgi:hypothetical protein
VGGRINIVQRNCTSRVPGLRLRYRRNRYGRVVLELDVQWSKQGRKGSTSYSLAGGQLAAVERGLRRRRREVGAVYDITPRQALRRLKQALTRGAP